MKTKKVFNRFSVFPVFFAVTAGCATTWKKGVCNASFSKSSERATVLILILTLLMCLSIASCTPFCLYPLARMFGGPKESELEVIRKDFSRMKRDLQSSKLVVYPSCLVNFELMEEWKSETPELIVALFRGEPGIEAYAEKTHPDVAFMALERNQMRYMWDRARTYAAWVKDTHPVPEGEYAIFTDFLCPPYSNCAFVAGVHVYITDSAGNICYATLINSHYKMYQEIQPHSLDDCCTLAVQLFINDLKRNAIELYPPYGVG